MPRKYPSEFREKVLDLVRSGRPVSEVAEQLVRGRRRAGERRLPDRDRLSKLGCSVWGYYAWKNRPLSAWAVRHAMRAEVFREVHYASRQTYGARRVHAELVLGRGLTVARCTVELVMRTHGLSGLPGRPKCRKIPNQPSASDLVDRLSEAKTRVCPLRRRRGCRGP